MESNTKIYAYDAVGNVLTAANSTGTTTYTYDNLDHLATAKDPHNALLTYTYDIASELTQVKYPDNKLVSYTYTPAKQLSTVKDWNNSITTYLYDNEGRVGSKTYPNTIKATYTYDSNGNLSNLTYKKGSSAFTKYDYLRDNIGNVTEAKETKASGSPVYDDYTYDAINEVTLDDAPNNTWSYSYDSVGNMATSVTDGTTTNYTYNASNRLTSKGTRSFTYDNQGNEITDATKTLGYDYNNLLKTYTSGSITTSYKYDASGNRIEKNGATNYQYINSGNNQVMVTKNVTNGTSSFNFYGIDLISQGDTASTARQYYLTDGLGSVRYLTNSSGTALNSYSTDPFGGNQTGSGTTANNYTYQAEQKDSESNLVYLRARYYDPTTGRFTSADPLSGSLGDTTTQNGYDYANNNPISLSDPLGLAAQCGASTVQQQKIPNGLAYGSIIIGKNNQNDFRKMSDSELSQYGINAHQVKQDIVLKDISKYDIYRSKSTGDLYLAQRNLPRGSELQPINMRVASGNLYDVAPGVRIPDLPIDGLPIEFPDIPF